MKIQNDRYQKALHAVSVLAIMSGIVTLIPFPIAKEASILGYNAICSFSPISSILLIYLGVMLSGYVKRMKL